VLKHIDCQDLSCFATHFDQEPKNRLALNAVTQNGIGAVALDRKVVNASCHTYSHTIETPAVTHQQKTGRCWLFAGLNTLRLAAVDKLNVKEFELSQAYLTFYDKLEKANFFLESVIETRNEPLDGRLVMWLLADPIPDGGQWDMFVSLVKKYGVVPKGAMPETKNSSLSRPMNSVLVAKLRQGAQQLRHAAQQGASLDELRQAKRSLVEDCYRILAIHLGQPPATFNWAWRDKDKAFHGHGSITPSDFFAQYVGVDLDEHVCLINAPTADKPFNRLYTVRHLGNVVGGQPVRYLNVELDVLKRAAQEMVVAGQAVWFGCDVGKLLERERGIMDVDVYDYELVYGTSFELDKAQRLDYGHSRMTHAMVLTGVDLDTAGQPRKWRVENSWGAEVGDKGFMTMSQTWFEQYLYEITIDKRFLPPELLSVLETEPCALPPWDPMGALARAL